MPHPSEAHTNGPLSNFISSYTNGAYIADEICPPTTVKKSSDVFKQYSRRDAAAVLDDAIAATGEANEADYSVSEATYAVTRHALKGYVTADEVADSDDPMKPLEDRAWFLMNAIAINREIRVANLFDTAANYAAANTSAAGNVWTDATNGTPLDDIDTMRAALAPGQEADTEIILVLTLEGWQALRKHPQVLGNGATKARLDIPEAQDLFQVDRIFVSEAQKDTANRGQTASYSRIWTSSYARMVRVPKNRGNLSGKVSGLFGATFRFAPGDTPMMARTWDAPQIGTDGATAVQVAVQDDEKVVQNDMAYLLTGITA